MADNRILYLCDMKKNCNNSPTCGKNWPDGCFHTCDITHAKNFESIRYCCDSSPATYVYEEQDNDV